jgi:hypothetical protein
VVWQLGQWCGACARQWWWRVCVRGRARASREGGGWVHDDGGQWRRAAAAAVCACVWNVCPCSPSRVSTRSALTPLWLSLSLLLLGCVWCMVGCAANVCGSLLRCLLRGQLRMRLLVLGGVTAEGNMLPLSRFSQVKPSSSPAQACSCGTQHGSPSRGGSARSHSGAHQHNTDTLARRQTASYKPDTWPKGASAAVHTNGVHG